MHRVSAIAPATDSPTRSSSYPSARPWTGRCREHRLQGQLDQFVAREHPPLLAVHGNRQARIAAEGRAVAGEAAAFQRDAKQGQAIGRIVIPRIGLNMILVDGADESSPTRGPGLYRRTSMPVRNRLVYVAGAIGRPTFAPFSHIDEIAPGDVIRLQMPYATFVYQAHDHQIVPATDLAMLDPVDHELLRLQACHPRFFTTDRHIVDADLVRVQPRGLPSWQVAMPATTRNAP